MTNNSKGFVQNLRGELKTLQIVGKRAEVSAAPQGAKQGLVVIYNANPKGNTLT